MRSGAILVVDEGDESLGRLCSPTLLGQIHGLAAPLFPVPPASSLERVLEDPHYRFSFSATLESLSRPSAAESPRDLAGLRDVAEKVIGES